MRLHATVSKDGPKLRRCLYPSRRMQSPGGDCMLLRMRTECLTVQDEVGIFVTIHSAAKLHKLSESRIENPVVQCVMH